MTIFALMYRILFFVLLLLFSVSKLSSQQPLFDKADSIWAHKILSNLSTRQKVAQLFMTEIYPKPDQKENKKKVQQLIKKQKTQ